MVDLFSIHNKVNIVELTQIDVLKKTDNYNLAFELIRRHQDKYPEIEKWFKTKVANGIIHNTRSAFIGFDNDIPFATAVVKKGENSKFCHLYIEEELRHQNIGDVFFILMAISVRNYAQKVHFSLPEGLWEEKKNFFNSFGFNGIEKYPTQYRKFEEELRTSVDFNKLWDNILLKIPDLIKQFSPYDDNPLNGIVMSIQPKYSKQILDGKKEIEIRKKFNPKWKNHKLTMYSSSPVQELVGYATIKDVIEDKPELIWLQYASQLGCSKSEFEDYTKGCKTIFAIVLTDVNKFQSHLSLNYLRGCVSGSFTPPQSYSSVKNTDWKNAISIAELLEGRLNFVSNKY